MWHFDALAVSQEHVRSSMQGCDIQMHTHATVDAAAVAMDDVPLYTGERMLLLS
jgi:hypothetical protein